MLPALGDSSVSSLQSTFWVMTWWLSPVSRIFYLLCKVCKYTCTEWLGIPSLITELHGTHFTNVFFLYVRKCQFLPHFLVNYGTNSRFIHCPRLYIYLSSFKFMSYCVCIYMYVELANCSYFSFFINHTVQLTISTWATLYINVYIQSAHVYRMSKG